MSLENNNRINIVLVIFSYWVFYDFIQVSAYRIVLFQSLKVKKNNIHKKRSGSVLSGNNVIINIGYIFDMSNLGLLTIRVINYVHSYL